jgi:RNA polymerase sigma-70 factor (ECF subfamily)
MEAPSARDTCAAIAAFGSVYPESGEAVNGPHPSGPGLAPVPAGLGATDDPDAALMLAYAGGQAAAFDALYARHCGGSYRYFLRSLRNEGLAQELLQDLWINVIRARATYEAQARFATWLYRMAHNRLIDHYRRASVVELVALEEDDDQSAHAPLADGMPGPEATAAARESARRMLDLVEALPAAQREAFLLQEEGGLSLAEIAQATGAGVETVKSRLRYAMTRLREGMKDFI